MQQCYMLPPLVSVELQESDDKFDADQCGPTILRL